VTKKRREPELNIADASRPRVRLKKPAAEGGKGKPITDAALPPLSILESPRDSAASVSRDDLKNWTTVLEEKLTQFGVEGKVTAVHHGPVVTTFEFEPAPGVRIKDIVSRADDLSLAMRARSLRMIAPIPGRAAVGIEIPNPTGRTVYLQEVLSELSEQQRLKGVMIGLGVDVVGKPFLMNLCEAPHLLIAGTTGSGKSVCLNTILTSILLHYRPSDVQLLLVDPKMVEMSQYNGIPHLLHPVITDPKEAARVLEYLVGEMGRRNDLFRRHGVRNIDSYNAKIAMMKADETTAERLSYIVVVVDELGDLALAKGVDIETLLTRLAQMARAAGIHMVLATQRPSVDVIVGKTKANFPTRIAFRVATKVDSRTILDTIGADKLLGKGDMLYLDSHHQQPLRLHGIIAQSFHGRSRCRRGRWRPRPALRRCPRRGGAVQTGFNVVAPAQAPHRLFACRAPARPARAAGNCRPARWIEAARGLPDPVSRVVLCICLNESLHRHARLSEKPGRQRSHRFGAAPEWVRRHRRSRCRRRALGGRMLVPRLVVARDRGGDEEALALQAWLEKETSRVDGLSSQTSRGKSRSGPAVG
jgi:hypothetical protein